MRRAALAAVAVVGIMLASSTPAWSQSEGSPLAGATRIHDQTPAVLVAPSRVESQTFESSALGRAMPYLAYLPPGYDSSARRYPVLYMLHGMGGTFEEWRTYGLFDAADRMIRAGEIAPMVIVLPQGDQAYWVDHAAGDRLAWGAYTARDVVSEIDARYRTRADPAHRAIGGISMGAHGAVQLSLNYPGTFGVVGAHSLVLRRFGDAPAYFGNAAEYAKRDPMQLVSVKAELMRSTALWVDIGDGDPWAPLASQFDGQLTQLGIAHDWHEWHGDHSQSYWRSHLTDYLRFYGRALTTPK